MPLVVNTNIESVNAQRNLMLINRDLAKSLQRLSSGKRVNIAGDDAAGLAIATDMRAKIKAYEIGERNINDAIGALQIADGATQEISGILQRMYELAKQAGNDTYDSTKRGLIKTELQNLWSEIDRVARSTEFNGKFLINGTVGSFYVAFGPNNSAPANSSSIIDLRQAFGNLRASTGGLALGAVAAITVATTTLAQQFASRVNTALGTVNTRIANLGAYMNRLEAALRVTSVTKENYMAAESRIRDADIAAETAALTRAQILQQSTISILSQANQGPQAALSLLR